VVLTIPEHVDVYVNSRYQSPQLSSIAVISIGDCSMVSLSLNIFEKDGFNFIFAPSRMLVRIVGRIWPSAHIKN
jgi:hypothetical protein